MVLGLILYEVSVVGGGVNGFLGSIFYWHTVVGGGVKLYRCIHASRNGDHFFIHRTEIFDFVVR